MHMCGAYSFLSVGAYSFLSMIVSQSQRKGDDGGLPGFLFHQTAGGSCSPHKRVGVIIR